MFGGVSDLEDYHAGSLGGNLAAGIVLERRGSDLTIDYTGKRHLS